MTSELSDKAYDLLHQVRLRGFVPTANNTVEGELAEAGLVALRGTNVALSPAGRDAHAVWARLPRGQPRDRRPLRLTGSCL